MQYGLTITTEALLIEKEMMDQKIDECREAFKKWVKSQYHQNYGLTTLDYEIWQAAWNHRPSAAAVKVLSVEDIATEISYCTGASDLVCRNAFKQWENERRIIDDEPWDAWQAAWNRRPETAANVLSVEEIGMALEYEFTTYRGNDGSQRIDADQSVKSIAEAVHAAIYGQEVQNGTDAE